MGIEGEGGIQNLGSHFAQLVPSQIKNSQTSAIDFNDLGQHLCRVMGDLVVFEVNELDKPEVLDKIEQGHDSIGRGADVVPLGLDGDQFGAVHEGHEQHLETLRVDVVAFDLQMHKIGVVFWNKLGEG